MRAPKSSAVTTSVPGHIQALDGLRGLAVLAVFCAHYMDYPLFGWKHSLWFGFTGVDLFFVLSGFLITGVLYDNLGTSNYFRNFYIRRALRIFPLYYAIWLACLLLTPFVHVGWNRYVVAQMLYVGNLTLRGIPVHPDAGLLTMGHVTLVFGHFWSLCVEEQFYLLWPLVVFFVRSRKALLRTAVIGAALILPLRIGLQIYGVRFALTLYNASFTRFDSLLIGAALLLWLRGKPQGVAPVSPAVRRALILLPLFVLAVGLVAKRHRYHLETDNAAITTFGFTLLAISASGLILTALDGGSRTQRVLTHPWLVSLGTVSYGFYVFHAIPMLILGDAHLLGDSSSFAAKVLLPPVAFLSCYALARLSFRYFESPFLRLKDKLAPQRHRPLPTLKSSVPPSYETGSPALSRAQVRG